MLPLLLALLKRPGEYQRQHEGLPTTGMTGMPVTEDLKELATRYFTRGQASHEAEPLSCS